jgi:hypothetical protein
MIGDVVFRVALVGLMMIGMAVVTTPPAMAQSGGPVYELRIYTTVEGRLPALLARFKDHTVALFVKHGMENVGYWVPADPPKSQNTLYFILRHKSRAAATASWDAFWKDPEWLKVQKESEASGKIVDKMESVFLSPTDFSKLK